MWGRGRPRRQPFHAGPHKLRLGLAVQVIPHGHEPALHGKSGVRLRSSTATFAKEGGGTGRTHVLRALAERPLTTRYSRWKTEHCSHNQSLRALPTNALPEKKRYTILFFPYLIDRNSHPLTTPLSAPLVYHYRVSLAIPWPEHLLYHTLQFFPFFFLSRNRLLSSTTQRAFCHNIDTVFAPACVSARASKASSSTQPLGRS